MDEIFLNGNFIPRSQAQISIMDRGFLFGDGVYELIPVYNRKPFLIDKHLARLKNSLNLINMSQINNIESIINKLIEKNEGDNFHIYLHITRGVQKKRQHVYSSEIEPTIVMLCEDYPSFSHSEISTGFMATIEDDFRWLKSNIKSISLLGNVLLKNLASDKSCYETLLIRNNKLTEGSASNIFIAKNNIIYTPRLSNELLPGVTRDLLMKILSDIDFVVNESDISRVDLLDADEIWCSSSTNAVVPIVDVDNNKINDGRVGAIAMKAHNATKKFIENY